MRRTQERQERRQDEAKPYAREIREKSAAKRERADCGERRAGKAEKRNKREVECDVHRKGRQKCQRANPLLPQHVEHVFAGAEGARDDDAETEQRNNRRGLRIFRAEGCKKLRGEKLKQECPHAGQDRRVGCHFPDQSLQLVALGPTGEDGIFLSRGGGRAIGDIG